MAGLPRGSARMCTTSTATRFMGDLQISRLPVRSVSRRDVISASDQATMSELLLGTDEPKESA